MPQHSNILPPAFLVMAILFGSCGPVKPNIPAKVISSSTSAGVSTPELTSHDISTDTPSITPSETTQPTSSSEPSLTQTSDASPTPSLTPEPCAPAKDGPLAGIDPRGQSLIWWHNYSTERDLYAVVFDFNYTNECDIRVQLKYQGSYTAIHEKMVSALANGNPPDLLVGYQNDQAYYQRSNSLVDLDIYANNVYWGLSPQDQADFYPSFWGQSVHPAYANQRLGFAINRSMEVMFYNTTWAKELGFDQPPSTPAEFEEQACAASQANGNGTGGYILRNNASALAAWTYAFGGDILDGTGTKYVFNSKATVDALTMLKRMVDKRCAYSLKGYSNTAFAARRALFAQGSSSTLSFYMNDLHKAGKGDQLAMIAIPYTTAQPRQNVYGGDMIMPSTTPERQLATWIFIKWFTSSRVQSLWVKVSNYYPTRLSTSGLLTSYAQKNPVWASAFELMPYAVYEPQLVSYNSVRELMQKTFDQIMRGSGADIQELLDGLTDQANRLQSEQSKQP